MHYKKIKSYEDACADQGKDPEALPDYSKCGLTPGEQKFNLAAFKLSRILASVNKDEKGNAWKPTNRDSRYFPWVWWNDQKDPRSGSRLSLYDVTYDRSDPYVASRLTCRDRQRALYVFEQFITLFEDLMIFEE